MNPMSEPERAAHIKTATALLENEGFYVIPHQEVRTFSATYSVSDFYLNIEIALISGGTF